MARGIRGSKEAGREEAHAALAAEEEAQRQAFEAGKIDEEGTTISNADATPTKVWQHLAGEATDDEVGRVNDVVAPVAAPAADPARSATMVLAPVIAWYEAADFQAATKLSIDLNFFGGIGHTVSIHCNDPARVLEFANLMNAGRILVNTPASQGAVGGLFNTLHPSLTLGCGTGGNNITTDNITARHLLNIQRIARRRANERLDRFDLQRLYDETLDSSAFARRFNNNY